MKTFQELLNLNELTALYKSANAIGEFFFTNTFYGSPQNVNSDTVEVINVSGTNRPGPTNTRGSAAKQLQPKGADKKLATIFHYFNELPLEADCLHALREPESYGFQEKGRTVLQLQVDDAAQKGRLTKEVILRSIIVNHHVELDPNGDLIEPTVNATTGAITNTSGNTGHDFGVADSHRGNLDGILSAWSTAGTKIGEELDILQRQNARNGCPRLETILTQSLNKSALRANTEFDNWAKYNSVRPDPILSGQGIDGLWGFNWRFIDGTYVDANGTTVDLIPQRVAVILPSLTNLSWLRKFQGSELVPTTLELAQNLEGALNSLQVVYGEYMYAQVKVNPTRLALYNGDHFGLGIPDVNAIWSPTAFAALSNLPA